MVLYIGIYIESDWLYHAEWVALSNGQSGSDLVEYSIFVNQSRYDILLSFCQWLYVINFFLLPCHNKTSYGT